MTDVACTDCGLSYQSEKWCDCVLSNEVWKRICPKGGVLCFNCIAGRLVALGIERVPLTIRSGPFLLAWDDEGTATALAAKDAEIAGLRDQLAFGRERTIDEKLDKLALKFAVAVAFEGIVLDPEKTERLREQIKKDAAKVYYLCAQPLYDKIAALAAKES